jgi:hypothetical protein
MPGLRNMTLIHTTSTREDANTDVDFHLEIQRSGGFPVIKASTFPPMNESEDEPMYT